MASPLPSHHAARAKVLISTVDRNNCGQHVRPYPRRAKIKLNGSIALGPIGFLPAAIPTGLYLRQRAAVHLSK
jgi:hypothetical protein